MKELKEFTVERLEELERLDMGATVDSLTPSEYNSLLKIALAAKQAKQVFIGMPEGQAIIDIQNGCMSRVGRYLRLRRSQNPKGFPQHLPIYTTPPLNHTEQHMVAPDGWIKCSERMPEDGQIVVIINAGHGEIYEAATVTRHGPHFLLLDGLEASNYDGGAVVTLRLEATHWTPLPAAPIPEM